MKHIVHRGGRALLLATVIAALGTAARVGAAEELALHGHVEQSIFVETPLSEGLAFEGGAAATLALALDARRDSASLRASLHLSALYGNGVSENSSFILALDDLALSWDMGAFAFELGKTYVNWGLGKAFSPADFFTEIDFSSGSPSLRSKFLGRATWFPGNTTRIDLVGDPYATIGPTLAARVYTTAFDSLAFSASAGIRDATDSSSLNLLGAIEATFDLPFLSPYGEAAVQLPVDDPAAAAISLLGGAMARAGDLTLLGEYLFSPRASLRHSIFAQATLPVDEWISLSAPLLYYPEPGSLSTGISLAASGLDGFDLGITALATRAISHSWSGKLVVSARFAF